VTTVVQILVDRRELRSEVPKLLENLGAKIVVEDLDIADYVCGTIGIERKTAHDFLSSIVDKRLFEQARDLLKAYQKAVVIIEGSLDRALKYRKIKQPQAYGALAALFDMGVSVLNSTGPLETAWIVFSIARRQEKKEDRKYLPPVKIKVPRYNKGVAAVQLNMVASIPGINVELAHRILSYFGTPRKFFKASSSELRRVPGLGDKRVKKIIEVLDTDYRIACMLDKTLDNFLKREKV